MTLGHLGFFEDGSFYFLTECLHLFFSVVFSFDAILRHLGTNISGGQQVVVYVNGINPGCYAQHTFPLPKMGKVTSNPMEQANSGFLPIR